MTTRETINEAVRAASEESRVPQERIIGAERGDYEAVAVRNALWRDLRDAGVSIEAIAHHFCRNATTVRKVIRAEITGVNHNLSGEDRVKGGIGVERSLAPPRPSAPDLPAYRGDWTEIDWMRAMAHQENLAMRDRA